MHIKLFYNATKLEKDSVLKHLFERDIRKRIGIQYSKSQNIETKQKDDLPKGIVEVHLKSWVISVSWIFCL